MPLREISQGCEYCDELSQRYEQAGVDGLTIVGGDIVLTAVGDPLLRPLDSGADGAEMAFRLIQQPAQAFDAAGTLISDTPEIEADGGVELVWLAEERDWLVSLYSVVVE